MRVINNTQVNKVEEVTRELVQYILCGKNTESFYYDGSAVWYADDKVVPLSNEYLKDFHYLGARRVSEEDIRFLDCISMELGSECISVLGRVEYHNKSLSDETIQIRFNMSWVFSNDKWSVKNLITAIANSPISDFTSDEFWTLNSSTDYNSICENVPVGIIGVLVNSGNLMPEIVNRNMTRMLGYSSLEDFKNYIGPSLLSLIHPDDLSAFRKFVQNLAKHNKSNSELFRIRKQDYSYIYVHIIGAVVSIDRLMFVCVDHSDHSELLESLTQENTESIDMQMMYKMMINNLPGGFHRCQLFDPISVDYVSDGFSRMSGYTMNDIQNLMQSKYTYMVLPDDVPVFVEAIYRLAEYPHTEHIYYRLKCKDGSIKHVSDIIQSIRHPDGRMWAYALVIDAESHYHKLQKFSNALERMPIGLGIFEYDINTIKPTYINNTFATIIGISEKEYQSISAEKLYSYVSDQEDFILTNLLSSITSNNSEFHDTLHLKTSYGMKYVNLTVFSERLKNHTYQVSVFVQNAEENESAFMDTAESKRDNENIDNLPVVTIQTFGYFEIRVDNKPIAFRSEKAREMLAILVDKRGGFASQSEIISKLWEDEPANKTTLARCRKTYKTLVDELKEYGIESIVESNNGARRIIPEKIRCDLFDYRSGKPQYRSLFKGSYLIEYSWAELTLSELMLSSNYEMA